MVALIGFASQKPIGNVLIEIDWTHPLTRGLVDFLAFEDGSFYPFNHGNRNRQLNIAIGSPRSGIGAGGANTIFTGSSQGLAGDFGVSEPVFTNAEFIGLGIQFNATGTNTSGTLMAINDGATFPYARFASISPSGTTQIHAATGAANQTMNSARSVYRDGRVHAVAGRLGLNYNSPVPGGTVLYGDGILEGQQTPPSAVQANFGSARYLSIANLYRGTGGSYWPGQIYCVATWVGYQPDGHYQWWSAEPWAFVRSRPRRIYYVPGGGGDEDASPIGVSGGGSAGSLSLAVASSAALTGVSAVGSVGSLTAYAGASANILGVQSQGHAGFVSVSTTALIAVTGLAGVGAAGTLTALAGAIQPVTGVGADGSVGQLTLTLSSQVALGGVAGAASVGSLSVLTGQIQQVSGVAATGSVGNIGLEYSTQTILTGAVGSGFAGQLLATTVGASYQRRMVSTAVAHRFTSSALKQIYTSTARH